MDLRRVPFQFVSSDPVARRAELLRKFGVPPEDKMFVDRAATDSDTDPRSRNASPSGSSSGSLPCSPRLQHRIPCFGSDGSVPIRMSHEKSEHSNCDDVGLKSNSENKREKKAPHVRIVPIKLADTNEIIIPKSSSEVCDEHHNASKFSINNPRSIFRESSKLPVVKKGGAKTKVCNIPVFVEEKNSSTTNSDLESAEIITKQNNGPGCIKRHNGGSASKSSKSLGSDPALNIVSSCDHSMKQISDVLSELAVLKSAVESFNGLVHDKQYRYLDEMLTRCMLKLDDVDTMGNEKIRACRKAAVKEVQSYINILESKVQMMEVTQCPDLGEQTSNPEVKEVVSSDSVGNIDGDEASKVKVKSENCEGMEVIETNNINEPEIPKEECEIKDKISSEHDSENVKVLLDSNTAMGNGEDTIALSTSVN